jgi:hypothetical protein
VKPARDIRNKRFIGTTKEAAEKVKQQIPRQLKSARDDKNEGLIGTT